METAPDMPTVVPTVTKTFDASARGGCGTPGQDEPRIPEHDQEHSQDADALTLVGNAALVRAMLERDFGSEGSTPEGASDRRPTNMNRFNVDTFSGDDSGSGVFCLEPMQQKKNEANADRRWLKLLRELPEARLARVMKIREQIQKGTYETDAKWRVAIDRLLEDLNR